nr:MAG TPA: hypothetical protein [Caudoviricetes sp.]
MSKLGNNITPKPESFNTDTVSLRILSTCFQT